MTDDRVLSPGSSDGHEEEVGHLYLCRGEFGDYRIIEEPERPPRPPEPPPRVLTAGAGDSFI